MTSIGGISADIGVALIAVAVAIVAGPLRQRRRLRRLEAARQEAAAWRARGYHLVQVVDTYQPARRGTKAIVMWDETGGRQDTWFWSMRPSQGSYLLVRGSVGWGPHNRNPNVLYLHPQDVIRVA